MLEREDAIAAWRALIGPGDPAHARASAPSSLRARFGTDRQANAAHGADSEASARREMQLFFAEEKEEPPNNPGRRARAPRQPTRRPPLLERAS